jgi:hypothetical protein
MVMRHAFLPAACNQRLQRATTVQPGPGVEKAEAAPSLSGNVTG